jgi:hypothetical protein
MQPKRIYHLSRDGQSLGKYEESVMREMLRTGRLRSTDDYWTQGMKAWAKLAILPAQPRNVATSGPKQPTTRPVSTPSTTGGRSNSWLKFWPAPVLLILALLIGYAASLTQEQTVAEKSAPATPPPSPAAVRPAPKPSAPSSDLIPLTRGFATFSPMGKELFPSHLLAFANIQLKPRDPGPEDAPHYGHAGFIAGVLIAAPRRGDKFTVEISADRFMKPSSVTFTATSDTRSATAGPAVLFDYEALAKLRQTTPFNVTTKVRRNEEEPVSFTEVWQAHQINDCPIRFTVLRLSEERGVTATYHHAGRTLAGFVNENHPQIDQLLAEAKKTGLCQAFTGYGEGKEEMMRQLQAVWAALQKRNISYSNTADSTRSPLHAFQHVRLLDQCLSSGQANCVDATTMMASVLKKIGFNVGIILVPKHAYLVVYDKTGAKREFAVETTGLSNATLDEAIKAATDEQPDNLRKIESLLGGDPEGDYHEVAIEECRREGIQPIPYSP